jgi:hypothetical protein
MGKFKSRQKDNMSVPKGLTLILSNALITDKIKDESGVLLKNG